MKEKTNRLLWIDIIRGLCVILMILEHLVLITLKINAQFWHTKSEDTFFPFIIFCDSIFSSHFLHIFKYGVVGTFFLISGYCFNLSHNNLKRFLKIASYAVLINLVTVIMYTIWNIDCLVLFGILHCFASCIIIWYFLDKIKSDNVKVLLAIIFFIISLILIIFNPTLEQCNVLMFLGIPKTNYRSGFDYFPIFPWLTIYSFGVLLYRKKDETRVKNFPIWIKKIVSPISFLGSHSLYFYVLHIPIIIILLTIIHAII